MEKKQVNYCCSCNNKWEEEVEGEEAGKGSVVY